MEIMTRTVRTKARPRLKKTTDLQDERAARELAIFTEYNELAAIDGQSRTQINKYLMEKYDIHSSGTIYEIRKRVALRLQKEGGMA
ncbi:MAG: hypothetical protein HDS59_00130 [Barnesiella sp.]|nr:hypothetical protein [Barnesiella sp.]